jgi:hypothetical protein
MKANRITSGAVVGLTAIYGWWQTGLHPFTGIAYLSIALPVAVLGALFIQARPPRRDPTLRFVNAIDECSSRQIAPLALVLLFGLALEIIGLAFGGRSMTVPTLSTVIDHALRWRGIRYLLLLVWLAAGLGPVLLTRRLMGIGGR